MNWLQRKDESHPPIHSNRDESREALARAEESLEKAISQEIEVVKVVAALREERQSNHFAERIMLAMRTS